MTAEATDPRQAAYDAADKVTTISRAHVEAIVNAAFATLAEGLYIADRGDGQPAVYDESTGRPVIGSWVASERLWALLAAVIPTREDTP